MYTTSENCPRKDVRVWEGKGLIHVKDLTDQKGLYGHGRLFTHTVVDPDVYKRQTLTWDRSEMVLPS